MTRSLFALLAGAVALLGTSVDAHHSMAEYLTTEQVVIRGEVVEFQFHNPHSFIYLLVTDADGRVARYAVEWSATSQLASRGITPTTLREGDELVITGFPAKKATERRLRLLQLERPKDGFVFRHMKGEVLG